ncbi:MAG: DNA repair protein RadC [Nitrospinae bacterium]|nr:DNA repair protein RadC [Nitrospinota bacterium]
MNKPRSYARQPAKEWPVTERPVTRMLRHGADGLSDAQLISLIIGQDDAIPGKTAFDIARDLIKKFGTLESIENAAVAELANEGLEEWQAVALKGALELGKRMVAERHAPYGKAFSTSAEVGKYFGPLLRNLKKEVFKIVLLDSQNTMMRDVTISEGSLDKSIVHPREVFKPAIRESAAAIILIHNHPSGDTEPSGSDKAITEKLAATGEVVGIRVLDHIIIGKKGYFSFCDKLLL